MKKLLLTAALTLGILGWAAAQSNGASANGTVKKEAPKKESKARKVSPRQAKNTAVEQPVTRLAITSPPMNDSLGIPRVKED
ncbi:MAG TPA: hypothetical protein VHK69_03890 [Chitinophagaceae bacterium]|jgi:hypothetical protein|nr:hypothetical protein [Chitinophagaceae bacterium]